MPRNADPIFWPGLDVDQSMRQQMQRNYNDSINILQTQWQQADIDQRFCLGDQDIWNQCFSTNTPNSRKMFNFNLINSTIQMVSGYQRRNRKSSICIPIHSGLQKTADQFTKCLYHVHSESNAYQVYSDAFEQGALTQGIGLVSIYPDYTNDPVSGDIKIKYVDFKSILIDPFFRKSDLSDCRFVWTRQFFDREEAKMLYPDFKDDIDSLVMGGYRDDKFYYMPEVYQIAFPHLIAFDEYWYLSSREASFLVDTITEEIQEFTGDEEDIRHVRFIYGERFKLIKKPKQTVRRALMMNDRVLVDEERPYGIDRYPYVPYLGYFTPDTAQYAYKFRGVVRDMRDAQYLFNRRKVTDLSILESQQQGLKIKKGALVTPEDGLNSGNGRVLVLNKEYQMSDVEPMPIIPPAPTMIQMEDQLKDVMRLISGVNEELLGSAVDDKAGILSMLRQGAGLTTLQRFFDQADASQKMCGDIIVEMIQKNWTYYKVRSVIGEEPSPEFDNKAFFKYGCKVVQGVLTESQHQLEFQQLLHLYELTGKNPVLLNRALEVSTIQEKDKLMEEIANHNKAEQEQAQKMSELQMQQMQVDTQMKMSYAKSQEGLAAERLAKIETDQALNFERIKRAQDEDASAVLDLVKALKELETIDTTNLQAKIATLQAINDLKFEETQSPMPQQAAAGLSNNNLL